MGEGFSYSAMISYSAKDAATANQLCAVLEGQGLRCWIAPRDVTPGVEYADEIMRGIERAATMVLLVSRHSNTSPHVLREVEQAIRVAHPIFPLFLEDVRLSKRLDYYIAPIHWLHLASASLEQHAATLTQAIQRDDAWKENGSPPTFARTLRFRPLSTLSVAFAAAMLVGVVLLGGAWLIYHRERGVEQATIDRSPYSLGYVSISSAEATNASPSALRLTGAVFLYGVATPYSEVRAQLNTGTTGDAPRIVDLSAYLDQRQVGGAQQFSFDTDAVGDQVIACLSLPHPRLPGRYRVTDVYAVTKHATAGALRVSVVRSAESRVTKEEGAPCR